MKTKTQEAIELYDDGDAFKALAIVSKFRRMPKEDIKILGQAYGIHTNRAFYDQIKSTEEKAEIISKASKILDQWVFDNRK